MNKVEKMLRLLCAVGCAVVVLTACGGGGSSSSVAAPSSGGATTGDSTTGRAGSLARFALAADVLYTISGANLKLFDVSDASSPKSSVVVRIASDIETLFVKGDYLFVGARNGMYIYDNKLAGFPSYVSQFVHTRSCDPVVVAGNYAYVTLRGGTRCGGFTNELEIIDIQDLYTPTLVANFPMSAPQGLGLMGDKLYVCDTAGLRTFATKDAPLLTELSVRSDIICNDLIPTDSTLIATSSGVVAQYMQRDDALTKVSAISETTSTAQAATAN